MFEQTFTYTNNLLLNLYLTREKFPKPHEQV